MSGAADAPRRLTGPVPRATRPRGGWLAESTAARLLVATAIVLGAGWLVSICCVIVFAARDAAAPSDAIVVLGAAQYAGRPSPVLRARLDHAIDLWRKDQRALLVFTGGTGTGDTTSEAIVSSDYAQKRGVPEYAVMLESEGRTTSESMRIVSALLRAQHATSVVLVSDPFHMFRLWILARRLGLRPRTSPTRTSPIGANLGANAGYIFSESLKAPVAFFIE